MLINPLPLVGSLNRLFDYNPETGLLTATQLFVKRSPPVNHISVGDQVGTLKPKGYREVLLDGTIYKVHRIIWKLYHHQDPGELTVDHIDRDPTNNRIINLRLATHSEQCFNRGPWTKRKLSR
jgi:hypothetical protein